MKRRRPTNDELVEEVEELNLEDRELNQEQEPSELIDTPKDEEIIKLKQAGEVVLVSSDYIVVNINGNNTYIHKNDLSERNKNPNIGDIIDV